MSFVNSPGPDVMKFLSCPTHLNMNFIMLVKIKMPTSVGILTFISMINTSTESLKAARKLFILSAF